MEEDDMDFTPSSNTSSNLASLFGFTKKPLQGNSSLTYTAPKPPKGESSPSKKQTEEKTKSKIIYSKAVHGYKLENRTYISQGFIGIVISGNYACRTYEIILYKRDKEHLSQIRISSSFTITLSPNNYASFYDNNKQNWSLRFQSSADVEQFSQKVAICKFYSHPEPPAEALIQDLTPSSQQKANLNSTIDVVWCSYALTPDEVSKLKGEVKEKIKLSDYGFIHLSKSLIGCAENCKRIIIIPHSLGGPWLTELNPNKDLLLEVKLQRIIPELENLATESKVLGDGPDSPIDSSAEETSVKARGASIKEALSCTRSQKANLISRMARMGQATLPVKPGLSAGQSDSEEETSLASNPKSRMIRSRAATSNAHTNSSLSQTFQSTEGSQLQSMYQNDLSWHQLQLGKQTAMCQQLIPVTANQVTSPSTDSNLSVYFSESRIQAAELRMGISKISEKLDLIWNKMQNSSEAGPGNKLHQTSSLDSMAILAGIQNLITENDTLKEKVEEQQGKIDQQNDRIFHLLELNHKYLEQNSTAHEKESANETKFKTEVESLQRKEQELEAVNTKTLDRVRSLEQELAKSEEVNIELKKRIHFLHDEAEALKSHFEENHDKKKKKLEGLKDKFSKASTTVIKLEEKLKEVLSENDSLKHVIKVQKEEIDTCNREAGDFESKKREYERTVEALKKQMSDEELKTESKIDKLSEVVARLEEENKFLREKLEKKDNKEEMESVMARLLSALKDHFSESNEYSASIILATVERIFSNTIVGSVIAEDKPKLTMSEPATAMQGVVPSPRTSLENVEASGEKKMENEIMKEKFEEYSPVESQGKEKEKKGVDEEKKTEKIDIQYKYYDQGWRTAKPPPFFLIDDDDDVDDWLN